MKFGQNGFIFLVKKKQKHLFEDNINMGAWQLFWPFLFILLDFDENNLIQPKTSALYTSI